MKTENEYLKPIPSEFKGITLNHVKNADSRACFAMELMRHLAIVAATTDGEDTAGRQKLRSLTPKEVVDRAVAISEAAWDAFAEKGWVVDISSLLEAQEKRELARIEKFNKDT